MRRPSERAERAVFAAVFVLLGAVVGYGGHAMAVQAPPVCAEAFALADGIFEDHENYTTAVHMMSTRGQSEYEGHEADAIQLWDDIAAAKAEYRTAKAGCLGDS